MEDKIRKAFEEMTMPDACDEKIQQSLSRPRRPVWRPVAVAACLLLALLILAQPPVVKAVEQAAQSLRQLVVSRLFPGSIVKDQQVFENGAYVVEQGVKKDGSSYNGSSYITGRMPTWLEAREDGLYFTGNGEELEIGSWISVDTPFTYQFTDDDGIRHYIAVGGTYDPEGTLIPRGIFVPEGTAMENVGWCEWFQESPYDYSSWIGGYGTNHWDNEAEAKWPWLETAEDSLGIPFP